MITSFHTDLTRKNRVSHMLADRYKIIKEFKAGGFSQTFLAKDLQHSEHQRCVIKKLQPKDTDAFTVKMARQLFSNEVNVLKRLGQHTQIPQLYTSFTEGPDQYLVEEFIAGHSLAREFRWGWRWSETKVLALLQDLLTTLAFVHRKQIVHRDLKPENLIRRQHDQRIVLIDFGAVKNHQTNPDAVVGTHGYMPLEQIEGRAKLSSDVYAVGMIALRALTGVDPTKQKFAVHEQTGNIKWRCYCTISPGLSNLIDTMINDKAHLRYGSATEALKAVNALIETLDTSVPDRRRFLQAAGYGAMGILGAGIALPAFTQSPANAAVKSSVPETTTSSPPSEVPVQKTSSVSKTTPLAAAPLTLNKEELIRRYGSYNECRKAAKARGIKFNCTPTWDKLAQAFGYSDAMQEISHRYMAAYPNESLSGIKVEVNL
ncbi:MAG: serine/threonine-protein kinase [Cyanobacteria bacterium P01_A01_bin.17]